MKHLVSELTGLLLDAAVAIAEGKKYFLSEYPEFPRAGARMIPCVMLGVSGSGDRFFDPSTDWSDGGPIIERERIELSPRSEDTRHHTVRHFWAAFAGRPGGDEVHQEGDTLLIAAMRAFVVHRIGLTVELGDEYRSEAIGQAGQVLMRAGDTGRRLPSEFPGVDIDAIHRKQRP